MKGRKPVPTNLRIMRGNPSKRPLPKDEPRPPAGVPEPPEWLSARGLAAWRDIAPVLEQMRVLTLADGMALALLCDAYAEYIEVREVSKRQAALSRQFVRAMLSEFGMTPTARARIHVGGGETAKDDWDELLS